jgi:hypothetical protein
MLHTIMKRQKIDYKTHSAVGLADGDCKGKGEGEEDSDSLRSSGVSSLRTQDANTQNQTRERVEGAKRRYSQFRNSKPDILDMMLSSELGQDEHARAEFEAWRAAQEKPERKAQSTAAG